MPIRLELARLEDERELRQLIANLPTSGKVRFCYSHHPNFFDSLDVLGQFNQVQVARETNNHKIVGLATRSIKSMFINGEIRQAGYLANLRIAKNFRGSSVLSRGFKHLQQLHFSYPCPFYLTTIMQDNDEAQNVLLNSRGNLPPYYDWEQYNNYLITDIRKEVLNTDVQLQFATTNDLPDVVEFLQREGRFKQFFPYYTLADFETDKGLLRNLKIEDILLLKFHDEIVGTLALWDQNNFKQTQIEGYHPLLKALRPIYNLYAKKSKKPLLEQPGEPINFYYAALVAVKNNDNGLFQKLLAAAIKKTQNDNKKFLALGLHAKDELNLSLRNFRHHCLKSNLYLVSFDDKPLDFIKLKQFTPYLELGAL